MSLIHAKHLQISHTKLSAVVSALYEILLLNSIKNVWTHTNTHTVISLDLELCVCVFCRFDDKIIGYADDDDDVEMSHEL